jgi:hypothetical protein
MKPNSYEGLPVGQPVGTRPLKQVRFIAECPQCGERCEEVDDSTQSWQKFWCIEDQLQFVADFQL